MIVKNRPLTCDFCGTICADRPKLVSHLDKHRNLRCNVCGKTYETSSNLRNHLKSHFDENVYVICDICGRSVYKWKLSRHKERHDPKKKLENNQNKKEYLCRFCGLSFDKANNRSSHEKRIHKDKSNLGADTFKCNECISTFRTKEELREHSFEHFLGKVHFCDFPGCDRYFKKGKLLTVHKKSHFEPQVKCLDCGALFVHRSALFKHQKMRCPMKKPPPVTPTDEELERNAKIAKEQFIKLKGRIKSSPRTKKEDLQQIEPIILKKEVDINPVKFEIQEVKSEVVIEEWEYEFLDEALTELKEPQENENFKPQKLKRIKFICDLCGWTDDDKDSLKQHLKSHKKQIRRSKNILHSNNIQDSKNVYSNNSSMKQKRIFNNRKRLNRKTKEPFECDFCGKKYLTRSSIWTHLLVTHKTTADFNCDQCCRKFKSHGNLIRHKRSVHSDGKQFGCEKCGAMFTERYQLEIHVHNHDEPTECSLCGRMVSNIKVHMRHHASKGKNIQVKCPMCDKEIGKYQLIRHIKAVHEKQYQSDPTNSQLKVYTCRDCGEFFSRRHELRQHEYINHSQSKIYECNVCGTYFKKLKLLNVHRFSHQPLNIACEICNNVYARKGALHKHQKKHHPELFTKQEVIVKQITEYIDVK